MTARKNLPDRRNRPSTRNPIQFREGGAGVIRTAASLYTAVKRGKRRQNPERILPHGASSSILVDAHPHIGTDNRRVIETCGTPLSKVAVKCTLRHLMDALIIGKRLAKGIVTDTGRTFPWSCNTRHHTRTRCIPLAGSQRSGNRSQRHRRRSTSGTSRFPDRPDTIPQPATTRQIPARHEYSRNTGGDG